MKGIVSGKTFLREPVAGVNRWGLPPNPPRSCELNWE